MIIDTEKIQSLLDSGITGYKISKETGIQETQIGKYRRNELKFENMTIATATKFMKYIRREDMKKFEIVKNTIEVKKGTEYRQGITQNVELNRDQYPEILESFSTLEEAKTALKNYTSEVEDYSTYLMITEYFIQENQYDEDGDWEAGGDVWEYAPLDIKSQMTEYNLINTFYDHGNHELEFNIYGQQVFLTVRNVGPVDDEDYWTDDRLNEVVEEAKEEDIDIK